MHTHSSSTAVPLSSRWLRAAAIGALVLAASSQAHATPIAVSAAYTMSDLTTGHLALKEPAVSAIQGPKQLAHHTAAACQLSLDGGTLTFPDKGCDGTLFGDSADAEKLAQAMSRKNEWGTPQGVEPAIHLELSAASVSVSPSTYQGEVTNPALDGWYVPSQVVDNISQKTLYAFVPGTASASAQWRKLEKEARGWSLSGIPAGGKSLELVLAADVAGKIVLYPTKLTATRNDNRAGDGAASRPGKTKSIGRVRSAIQRQDLISAFEDCRDPQGRQRHVICVDAFDESGSKPPEVSGSSDSVHIITPNTSVLVMVRHAQGTALRIAMAGQPGLTTLGYQNTVSPQGGESKRGPAVEAPPPMPVITTHSFAPRKPGSADIRVQLYDDANKPLYDEQLIEVIVEQTYIGALRVGIGTVFGNAVERTYASQKVAASGQYELVSTSNSAADPELVLGFAPFIFEAFSGGRRYSGDMSWARRYLRLAPYIGVGLLTQTPKGIDGFKTFYFGLEWEPAPSFSIAVTGALRRVTRPGEGLDIGSPLPDAEVPTRTGYALGWGVVVNVTPEFLKLSGTGVSSFLK